MGKYLMIPSGRRILALESKKLIDDYLERKISLKEAQEQVAYWALKSGIFMFEGEKWNPTFRLHLGKKRLAMLEKMLPESMQVKSGD